MFMGVILERSDRDDEGNELNVRSYILSQEDRVMEEIERLLNNQFADLNHDGIHRYSDLTPDPNRNKPDMTNMFKKNLPHFINYLKDDLGSKMGRLHDTYYQYRFDSPLNFIMVKSDFKSFYESFTQAKLSLLYSLELHKDSMFAIRTRRSQDDRQKRSLDMSNILYKNFEKQVEEMHNILEEYHHLLEHDNFDCSTHLAGQGFLFKCWFKRYGFPLVCLVVFGLISFLSLKTTLHYSRARRND